MAMVLNSLGGAQQAKGNFDGAIKSLERSLDIVEELGDRRGMAMVLNSLGGVQQAKGNYDGAIKSLERSLKIGETLNDQRHITMVDGNLRKTKRWMKSIEKWSVGQITDLTAIDHRRIAKDLKRKGDFEGALYHILEALNSGVAITEEGRVRSDAGEIAFRLKDYDTAISQFQLAIAQGQDDSFTNASLARALCQLQESPEIIRQHFERALALDEKNAWAHSWYSTFLKETGDVAMAEVHARKAVELKPENAVFLNNLALILMDYGDRIHLSEARMHLQKALTCAPPDFDWPQRYLKLAEELLRQEGELDPAEVRRGVLEISEP